MILGMFPRMKQGVGVGVAWGCWIPTSKTGRPVSFEVLSPNVITVFFRSFPVLFQKNEDVSVFHFASVFWIIASAVCTVH